jgi:hypothetical protein
LVGTKVSVGKLGVQQPVVQVSGLRAFMIEQELTFRLLAQDAVLDSELVVLQFDLLDAVKGDRLELLA